MARRNSKKKKKKKSSAERPLYIYLEYYHPFFSMLHHGLKEIGYDPTKPHPIRKSFWQFVSPRRYYDFEARAMLKSYLDVLEKELASVLKKHSLGYWLHAYRRLSPGPIGQDKRFVTIGTVRAILEAAIQKYACMGYCAGIAFSNQIPEDKVLDGMLMQPQYENIRKELKKNPSLVLTKFGLVELIELYDSERLAYEIWRATAHLRAIGKGASLVAVDNQLAFADDRSDELDELITIYDKRNEEASTYHGWDSSNVGMVYLKYEDKEPKDRIIFLPLYNFGGVPYSSYQEFFKKVFRISLIPHGNPNFIFTLFSLNNYFKAHEPFSEAFEMKHGVSLKSVVGLISAVSYFSFQLWFQTRGQRFMHHLLRGYDGPWEKEFVYTELAKLIPDSLQYSGLNIKEKEIDFSSAAEFFELNGVKKKNIDLFYPGPHCIFLPIEENRIFIDYAWILRRLYDLFVGINIPDQNFKGEALENLIRKGKSSLPVKECKALNGTKKQIDAAFSVKDTLIIGECKAIGKSIAYDRGDPVAIEFRKEKIDGALKAVDEKAKWLADNPVGTNYDIRSFRRILPIVITPFVEFIPSLDVYYWISKDLPRVLMPSEVNKVLEKKIVEQAVMSLTNTFPIRRTD